LLFCNFHPYAVFPAVRLETDRRRAVNIVKRIKSIELETPSNWTAIPPPSIASSDLHSPVYLSDYRIVPVVTANRASPRERRRSNLKPAIGIFSSTAQTSPHIPGNAPASPHAPAARQRCQFFATKREAASERMRKR
jgi:hypothetical protein